MKATLKDEMKRTLFDISLSHMQKQKKQLTLKSANRFLTNYKKAMYSTSHISISSQLCEELSCRFQTSSPEEIIVWLDSVFLGSVSL